MRMLPPPGATGTPVAPIDAFDVPVFVRQSKPPLTPGRRPPPARVIAASAPWPTYGCIPRPGAYRVATTWRDLIDATTSVGREPTAWLTAVPALAWSEIIARRSPLSAYLGRTRLDHDDSGTGYFLEPNVVYTHGTEISARSAFAYRIGMTMAEWACRGLMGLGPTSHAEACTPAGVGPNWSPQLGLPDLVGDHPATGLTWLVEAKASRRLGAGLLKKGAEQLCRPGLMRGPHVKLLSGTSLTDRLFVTIDTEGSADPPPSPSARAPASPEDDDDQLLALARSRMLLYLALSALPRGALRVLPVGPGVMDRPSRAGGTVTLLEDDPSTSAERRDARGDDRYRQRPVDARLDMLTGPVPGTDLIIGMSRRLYGACDAVARLDSELASQVNHETPELHTDEEAREGDGYDPAVDAIRDQRRHRFWEMEREYRAVAVERARDGFTEGASMDWEDLLGDRVEFRPDPAGGVLEAATADTYLAVDARSVSAEQPTSRRR